MALTMTQIRKLVADGNPPDAADVLSLANELEQLRAMGNRTFISWPSFTNWNFQCEIKLPPDPDDQDFEYAINCLRIAREGWANHRERLAERLA